ncbi:hypothetical protein HPB48_011597 [Haemaphysalis longicornis]|uniref:Uncharacterized protein n=1 Tax=Haemaphysalis longicornis TaxID=44386 RepID=A0A9J6GM16_HAELO|nr:hypothetical protein HPB48_011597 [Haemaphysalis longicornis]
MDRDDYYEWMRMTKAEQHELLREIIHGDDAISTSVTGLLQRTRRLRQAVRPLACHGPLQPVQRHLQQHRLQRVAFVICGSTGKVAVAVGGTTVHAFSCSLAKPPAPTGTEASATAS